MSHSPHRQTRPQPEEHQTLPPTERGTTREGTVYDLLMHITPYTYEKPLLTTEQLSYSGLIHAVTISRPTTYRLDLSMPILLHSHSMYQPFQ